MQPFTFLTAEWRDLVMLNYAVDPAELQPLVPCGTELDFYGDRTFVSVIGFRFLRTRIFGVPILWHTDFEEVNLRFYVRRQSPEGWRRGVVFVRELVPRFAIAFIARTFYGEPYTALPMRHRVEQSAEQVRAEYRWKRAGRWESLWAVGAGVPQPIQRGSEEEFITEHYWGYTARPHGSSEYEVEHPRWQIRPATAFGLEADIAQLYGPGFAAALSAPPASAFIAVGSPVRVKYHAPVRH